MVLIVALPNNCLRESGSCPVTNRNIKRVLRIICSLVHFCDSHYSMYNGIPMHMCTWLWIPSSQSWTLQRPIHHWPPTATITT